MNTYVSVDLDFFNDIKPKVVEKVLDNFFQLHTKEIYQWLL